MVMDVAFTPDLIEDAPTRFRRSDFPTSSVATLPRLGDESEVKTSTLNDLPTAGEKFGEFAIVAEIGKGAFSRVYLAHQIDMAHRLVALKVTLDSSGEIKTIDYLGGYGTDDTRVKPPASQIDIALKATASHTA